MHNLFDFGIVNLKISVYWQIDDILPLTNTNLTQFFMRSILLLFFFLYVRLVSISCNACNNKPIKDSFPKIPAVQLIYELVQV